MVKYDPETLLVIERTRVKELYRILWVEQRRGVRMKKRNTYLKQLLRESGRNEGNVNVSIHKPP